MNLILYGALSVKIWKIAETLFLFYIQSSYQLISASCGKVRNGLSIYEKYFARSGYRVASKM
jgi:hypothetical protein